jgi:hypothetical protein
MDVATQENAALVEESAAASKTMEQQTQSLVSEVSFFRLRGQDGMPPQSYPQHSDHSEQQHSHHEEVYGQAA